MGWAVEELATYSTFDFEYFFRRIYEAVYISHPDGGHQHWSEGLALASIVFDQYSGIQYLDRMAMETYVSGRLPNLEFEGVQFGTNYWENLTYPVSCLLGGDRSDTERLKYLDLPARPGTRINREIREDVLYRLNIECDSARLRKLGGVRWFYFGDVYNAFEIKSRRTEQPWE
ncbi:hypothetical protein FRX31_025859 [Thalictrum thalictroides]|uniref:Uncharacterized protein n=1 Tax=Thalictrum thalictroides TaxID=46969 RepID=A0A7J6VHI0_THATH|nr:hypothetical protein FRX31_025859 [Thalictrum thalictroides]